MADTATHAKSTLSMPADYVRVPADSVIPKQSQTADSIEDCVSSPFDKITGHKKRMFLVALSEDPNQVSAARLAGASRTVVYHWRRHDPDFAAAFAIALELGAEALEAKAHERAMRNDFPSDTLAIFLLKGSMPAKYGDRQRMELSGPGGGAVKLDYSLLSDDQLAALEAIVAAATVRPAAELEPPTVDVSSQVVEPEPATVLPDTPSE